MNNSKQLLGIARTCHRHFSKSASSASAKSVSKAPTKKIEALRETQRNFQIDDGIPVYVKGGRGDRLLYQFTLGVTAVGLGMVLDTLYRITFK